MILLKPSGGFTSTRLPDATGIICKNTDEPYVPDKRNWVKWKHRRTIDCVVGGYRIHKDGDKIGSLLLGLYNDEGQLHFIGHCSGFTNQDRVEILRQFEQLRSEESLGMRFVVRVARVGGVRAKTRRGSR